MSGRLHILSLFGRVDRWSAQTYASVRRTWIEITGLPLQAWKCETIKRICELLGNVIRVNCNRDQLDSYESIKAQIDSFDLLRIHDSINVLVEDDLFFLYVNELDHCQGVVADAGAGEDEAVGDFLIFFFLKSMLNS